MADTSDFKKIIEPWFRDEYLPQLYSDSVITQENKHGVASLSIFDKMVR